MTRAISNFLAVAAAAAVLQGCADQRAPTEFVDGRPLTASLTTLQPTGRYVVVFAAERVPADLWNRVSRLGGSVGASLDNIGVAVVTGLTEAAATELATENGIQHVEPDVVMTVPDDHAEAADASAQETASEAVAPADVTASPTSAQFYPRQWNMRAVFAPEAWAAGHLGSRDAVVAILDTGIDYLHPDLEGRVDLSRSISLVPSEDTLVASLFPGRHAITDLHSHGTATAGLIVSNALHLAGVTQRTTLFGVKVHDGIRSSPISVWVEGIMYAADHGADVIQLSTIAEFKKHENPGLVAAVNRAVSYAHRKGAVMVAPAGNTPAAQNTLGGPGDYDHDVDRFRLCIAPHVICVAATGPTSAASLEGPWVNGDRVTPYSNFGRSAIDVAAPGGTGRPGVAPALGIWVLCSQTTVVNGTPTSLCRPGENLILSSTGTSWSAATTSGLAALLVSTMGKGRPDQIEAAIEQSADDLGEPGKDPHFGWGRINIARALGIIP